MNTDLLERLEAALPVDDLVAWLLAEYPDAADREVMGMLQEIYEADFHIEPASSTPRSYRVGGETWDACPQRVDRA